MRYGVAERLRRVQEGPACAAIARQRQLRRQASIGKEAKEQMMEAEGRLPDTLIAAIGGGSNAMGLFYPFLDDKEVSIIGVEAGG